MECHDKFHIGATKAHGITGSKYRFLFVAACGKLRVFKVDKNEVIEIQLDNMEFQGEIVFLSELEIFEENGVISVAFPTVVEETHPISGVDVPISGIDNFTFHIVPGSLINIGHQEYPLSSPGDNLPLVKGLEFSPNGKNLFATYVMLDITKSFNDPNQIIPNSKILHLKRMPVGYNFSVQPAIDLGIGHEDFSFGMIEVSENNQIWFVGENRLGKFNDPNNLNQGSLFSVPISLPTTNSNMTFHDNTNANSQNSYNMIYLLPDQIDGEDFMQTVYFDQFPDTINLCSFSESLISNYTGNWLLYADRPKYRLNDWYGEVLYGWSGEYFKIGQEGYVTFNFTDENGCNRTELMYVQINPIVSIGTNFTYSTVVDFIGNLEIELTPALISGVTHIWKLYKMDTQGNWILINTCNQSVPFACSFTNLDISGHYKVEHEIVPNEPINCSYSNSLIKIIQ